GHVLTKEVAIVACERRAGRHGATIRDRRVAKPFADRAQPGPPVVVAKGNPRGHLLYVVRRVELVRLEKLISPSFRHGETPGGLARSGHSHYEHAPRGRGVIHRQHPMEVPVRARTSTS